MYDAAGSYFLSSYVCFAVYILRSFFFFELSNVKLQTVAVDRFCSLFPCFWMNFGIFCLLCEKVKKEAEETMMTIAFPFRLWLLCRVCKSNSGKLLVLNM